MGERLSREELYLSSRERQMDSDGTTVANKPLLENFAAFQNGRQLDVYEIQFDVSVQFSDEISAGLWIPLIAQSSEMQSLRLVFINGLLSVFLGEAVNDNSGRWFFTRHLLPPCVLLTSD